MPSNGALSILATGLIGMIGAAAILIIQHVTQERRRRAMSQEVSQLNERLLNMQKNFENLRNQQKKKEKSKRRRRNQSSMMSTTTSEDFTSVDNSDSSDMEFYDLSDDEQTGNVNSTDTLEKICDELDKKLEDGNSIDFERCLEKLRDLYMDYPENPELLWRIGKAHHKISQSCDNDTDKQDHINEGIEACSNALRLTNDLAELHKWYAILIGSRSDFQSIRDKIKDGHVFKKHIDLAMDLNPLDASLHHLMGRFAYEVAGLKWYERQVAAVLEAEPPRASYEDALGHFLKAEELSAEDWKENKMFMGKCYIVSGDYEAAVGCLRGAKEIRSKNELDKKFDEEIGSLLEKYCNYR